MIACHLHRRRRKNYQHIRAVRRNRADFNKNLNWLKKINLKRLADVSGARKPILNPSALISQRVTTVDAAPAGPTRRQEPPSSSSADDSPGQKSWRAAETPNTARTAATANPIAGISPAEILLVNSLTSAVEPLPQ